MAVIVWIRNHQRFCLSLVCLETQEYSDHICMFNELRWILWSQTLFNIVINKERNVLKCFFHIVNNIKEKGKGVKLGEMTGYFLHSRVFCSPVSHLPPPGALQYYRTLLQETKPFKEPPKSRPNSKFSQNLFKFLCCLWRKSKQKLMDLTAGLLLGELERILTFIPTPWYWQTIIALKQQRGVVKNGKN